MSLKLSRSTNARIAGSFAGAGAFECLGEGAPVEELGQRVGRRFAREPLLAVAQLLFDCVALGERRAHDPQHGRSIPSPTRP